MEYALPENRAEKGFLGVSPDTWARVLIITGLFAAVFWPNLRRLWLKTNPFTGEANWSHAIVVPVIGLYYLFVHREDLIRAGSRQFIWGPLLRPSRAISAAAMVLSGGAIYLLCSHQTSFSLMFSMIRAVGVATAAMGVLVLLLDWSLAWTLFGLGVFVYGIYPGQNDYLKDLGMVITLFGMVLMLCGPEVMKIAWFPIVFLICAIPWPGLVYSWIAEPLQTMAAWVAVHVLNVAGVDSMWQGTKINISNSNPLLPPRVLNVAEACAGMRSLMTFVSVGGAIAFLSSRPLWQKLIIVFSAIPIAIFCNVMRISGQGLLDHYVSPQWSDGFAHQFVGMMMLLPAFFLILGVGYLLDKLFIEEAEEDDAYQNAPRAVAGIAARESVIPALGATSSVAAPAAAAVVPIALPKPVVTTSSPAPVKPAPVKVVASRPPGTIPPRPMTQGSMTPANPRPAAAANGVPPRPVLSGQPMRMPPPPVNGVPRKSVDAARQPARPPVVPAPAPSRVPPSQPNGQKSKESK